MTHVLAIANENLWAAVALIAAWLVIMCLRQVASEIEHRVHRHNLIVEAKKLRIRQAERLRAISNYAE